VFGDCHGTAASPQLMRHIERAFEFQGFATARNSPYAGGYTTHLYARRQIGVHALQIEVNRALYLDEECITKTAGFAGVQGRLIAALRRVVEFDLAHLHPRRPAAAE
jgi:N-formylglutamate amidohydrolase